jgi:hypothetical protein
MAILKSEHLNLAVENEGDQTSRKFQADLVWTSIYSGHVPLQNRQIDLGMAATNQ